MTTGPGVLESTAAADSASVMSSPIGLPISSTRASRSAAGSMAIPISAPRSCTSVARSERFAAIGSGSRGNWPSGSIPIAETRHLNLSRSSLMKGPPAPCTQSTATSRLLERMRSTLMHGSSKIRSRWRGQASRSSVSDPTASDPTRCGPSFRRYSRNALN